MIFSCWENKWLKVKQLCGEMKFIHIFFALIVLFSIGGVVFSDNKTVYSLAGVVLGAVITAFAKISSSTQDRKNQLRLAAIEKRLEVHQTAYFMWNKLRSQSHDSEKMNNLFRECDDFWNSKCLYLTPLARKAFWNAYHDAQIRSELFREREMLRAKEPSDFDRIEEINEDMRKYLNNIGSCGRVIVEGVELPTINEELDPSDR